MIANYEVDALPQSHEIELPIHPANSLEHWVGWVHFAILDNALRPEDEARLMDQIRQDPEAMRFYTQACQDEAMIAGAFNAALPPEAVGSFASPIW